MLIMVEIGNMESVAVAGFLMLIVFTVLVCLWAIIKGFSFMVIKMERKSGQGGND